MPSTPVMEYKSGLSTVHNSKRLTPFAQSVRFTIPGVPGGFIWNRPSSLHVADADGNEEIIPIIDITRIVIWSLIGSAILMWLLAVRLGADKRR